MPKAVGVKSKSPTGASPAGAKSPSGSAPKKPAPVPNASPTPSRGTGDSTRQNALQSNTTTDNWRDNVRVCLPTGSPLASPVLRTRTLPNLPLPMNSGRESGGATAASEGRTAAVKQRPTSPVPSSPPQGPGRDTFIPPYGSSFTSLTAELREQVQDLTIELREQVQDLTMRIDSASEQWDTQRRELTDVWCSVENLRSNLDLLRVDVDSARSEMAELNTKSSDIQRQVHRNEAKMREIERQTSEEIEELAQSSIEDRLTELKNIEDNNRELAKQTVSSHAECAERTTKLEKAHLGYRCSLERLERDFRAAEAQASLAMGETSVLRDSVRGEIQESMDNQSSQRDALLSTIRANSRFAVDSLRRELLGRLDEAAALQACSLSGTTSDAAAVEVEARMKEASEASARSMAMIGKKCQQLESTAAGYMEDLENNACTLRRRQELLCLELEEKARRDAKTLQASLCEGSHKLRAELCDALGAHEARCQDLLSRKSQELAKSVAAAVSVQEESAACRCALVTPQRNATAALDDYFEHPDPRTSSPAYAETSVSCPPPEDMVDEKNPAAKICD